MNIKTNTRIRNQMKLFKPRLDEEEWYELVSNFPHTIKNTSLYEKIRALSETALPDTNEFNDKRWSDFYLPLKRGMKTIAVPVTIHRVSPCQDKLVVSVRGMAHLKVLRGKEKISREELAFLQDTARLIPFIQQDPSLVERLVPYDLRTGKIEGLYVLEEREIMPQKEKDKILSIYQNHCNKNLKIEQISLEGYLETAAVCYKAAFGKETEGLTPAEMYGLWSYQHSVEVFSIKNTKSKKEFSQKLQSTEWQGRHQFWLTPSRIHLYPPEKRQPHFLLTSGLYGGSHAYLKMVEALIKEQIPFQTPDLENTLLYLTGETDFMINLHSRYLPSIDYFHSPEQQQKYFSHIRWDPLNIPKWK